MILKAKEKEINIVIRTRKIARLTDKLKGMNLNEIFFKGLRDCNISTLAVFINEFAENEDGKNSFGSIQNVYDFIDDYMQESGKTYADIYKDLAVEINDMGFFNQKMTEKELEAKIKDPIGDININEIVNKVAEKEVGSVVQEEFRGYKA